MAVLIVLLAVFSLVLGIQAIGKRALNIRAAGCMAIAAMFLFAGGSHFGLADGMVLMLPSWVPYRYLIIYVTGVIELILGVGFLWPLTRQLTGILSLLFLLCVFPANVYAAMNSVAFGGNVYGPRYLVFRIPLQIFLMGWIWLMAIRSPRLARDTEQPNEAQKKSWG